MREGVGERLDFGEVTSGAERRGAVRATFGAVLILSFGLTTKKLWFPIRINIARGDILKNERYSEKRTIF